MKDVFMTAVYIASKTGKNRPLTGKRVSPFKGVVLSHEEKMYLNALAIGFEGKPDVISNPQRVVRIAEEFANAGIWDLEQILTTSEEGPLWDLADHILEELKH